MHQVDVRIGSRLCCENEKVPLRRCLEDLEFVTSFEVSEQRVCVSMEENGEEQRRRLLEALNGTARMQASIVDDDALVSSEALPSDDAVFELEKRVDRSDVWFVRVSLGCCFCQKVTRKLIRCLEELEVVHDYEIAKAQRRVTVALTGGIVGQRRLTEAFGACGIPAKVDYVVDEKVLFNIGREPLCEKERLLLRQCVEDFVFVAALDLGEQQISVFVRAGGDGDEQRRILLEALNGELGLQASIESSSFKAPSLSPSSPPPLEGPMVELKRRVERSDVLFVRATLGDGGDVNQKLTRCLEELEIVQDYEICSPQKEIFVAITDSEGSQEMLLEALAACGGVNATIEDVESPPTEMKTRLTVANLCCELETKLIKDILKPLPGVKEVRVNAIGRVAYVTHSSTVSPKTLVDALNVKRLGATVVDAGQEANVDLDDSPATLAKQRCIGLAVLGVVATFLCVSALYLLQVGSDLARAFYEIVILIIAGFGAALIVRKAVRSLLLKRLDVNVLMLVAFSGACALGEYVEAATVVVVFIISGHIERVCMRRVRRALREMVGGGSAVTVAYMMDGRPVAVADLKVGDVVSVRAGDRVPADGVVSKGKAAVDESCLTGESVPLAKEVGSTMTAGSIVVNGFVAVEVTKPGEDSTLSRMRGMVDEAQASTSPTQEVVAHFASFFTPFALATALVVAVVPPLVWGLEQDVWLNNALILLVVACPCALVVAAPIAVVSGVAANAKNGVLVKSGQALEALAAVNLIATDKTGTLTQGRCRVVDAIELNPGGGEKGQPLPLSAVFKMAAAVETRSTHPLATAVVNYAMGGCVAEAADEILTEDVVKLNVVQGQGITAVVDGYRVAVGNSKLVNLNGSQYETDDDYATTIYVAVEDVVRVALRVVDPVRDEALVAVSRLAENHGRVVMVTGDRRGPANAVAKQLLPTVVEVRACQTPSDKLNFVKKAQTEGTTKHVVLMIGDGVNDAPALALADVGVAMGAGGTALAVDAADVAVMNDDLTKLADALYVASFVRNVIRENIALALLAKLAVVAAVFAQEAQLWMAVLADVISLLVVVANGTRPLNLLNEYQGQPTTTTMK